jgi:hypothetical protein
MPTSSATATTTCRCRSPTLRPERATSNPRIASTSPWADFAISDRSTGQRRPSRFDRVELVRLAVPTTLLSVRTINLDHHHTLAAHS